MSSQDIDKVIDKIQKLLARTKDNRGATEAEADTAMKLAQELMAKHNLDMAAVEAASGPSTSDGATRVKEQMQGRAMYKWQQQLARYVAEANFCYHLIKVDEQYIAGRYNNDGYYICGHFRTKKSHVYVGRRANVITAQLMYQYLTQTIEDLVPIESNAKRLSRSAMSWKEGCADRLCERLAQRRQDLIDEHDARVKAEQEAIRKEAEAKYAASPKELTPNRDAQARHVEAVMGSDACDATGMGSVPEDVEQPEVDTDDTWSPSDVETELEAPTGMAMVLASVYDQEEHDANWEMAHGWEPGTLARWRAEQEERERQEAEEEAKAEMESAEEPVKVETERQRMARERREAREHEKWRRRWARESKAQARREAREWAKRDHAAYQAGATAGINIGLDTQVSAKSRAKQLKGRE